MSKSAHALALAALLVAACRSAPEHSPDALSERPCGVGAGALAGEDPALEDSCLSRAADDATCADERAAAQDVGEELSGATSAGPDASEPATREPATLEPATLEPATLEPATLEPATLEPATLEPATLEPATLEPATLEPATLEPATLEPATLEPGGAEPFEPGSRAERHAARLVDARGAALALEALEARVWVEGFRARVVLDAFFRGDGAAGGEGELELRLPGGASPYFFASGREARADASGADAGALDDVERTPSGHDPESICADRRERWQPARGAGDAPAALRARDGAGRFHARLALSPGGRQRVVVGYDLELASVGADLEYRLELPEEAERVAVAIRLAQPPGVETRAWPESAPVREAGHALHAWRAPPGRSFALRVTRPGALALASPAGANDEWFAARFTPELAARASAGAPRAVLLVDTSLSARECYPTWLALLRALLAENEDELREFAVLFFDVEPRWWRAGFRANTPAERDALLAEAEGLVLEGATDLARALAEAARPRFEVPGRSAPFDLFLLSDGRATWGEIDGLALARAVEGGGVAALYAFALGCAGADEARLAELARASGGALVPAVGAAELAAAARAHRRRPFVLEEVLLPGTRDLLLAGGPRALWPAATLTLVGRGRPREGEAIELGLAQDGVSTRVRTPLAHVLASELAARAYGEVAVARLEQLASLDAEARAYAACFGVPLRGAALVALADGSEPARARVRTSEAAELARAAPARPAAALDPRQRFVALLARLEQQRGREVAFPAELRRALPRLSRTALALEPEPIVCHSPARDDVPGAFRSELEGGEPGYEALEAEARRRMARHGAGDALCALSARVELLPGEPACLRDAAFAALELGFPGHAYHLLLRVADAQPLDAADYPVLARAAAAAGHVDLAIAWYEVALGAGRPERAGELRRIAALDYLRLLERVEARELASELGDWPMRRAYALAREPGRVRADLVVSIAWSNDESDVSLRVVEPSGEECSHANPRTRSGGSLSSDVTHGFGPETYVLSVAPSGDYRVVVEGPGARAPTRVLATIYEGIGGPAPRVSERVVSAGATGASVEVARLRIGR